MITLRDALASIDKGLDMTWGKKRAWRGGTGGTGGAVEKVALQHCRGRVLAESVYAVRDDPLYDVSAMDGYAVSCHPSSRFVSHKSVEGGGVYGWRVVGESRAGVPYASSSPLGKGMAVRIYTGAVMPEGSDRILLQEDAHEETYEKIYEGIYEEGHEAGTTFVTCRHMPERGAYRRQRGSAMKKGDMLFVPPCVLQGRHLVLLASLNRSFVSVIKKPRIALLASGDELAMLGTRDVPSHKIIASTLLGLSTYIEEWGGELVYQGIIGDDVDALRGLLWDVVLPQADMIVTTGGASVGRYDVVARFLAQCENKHAHTMFNKVAIRPGKPTTFALVKGCPFLCLPGNPVSSMLCGLLFLRPMFRRWFGVSDSMSRWRSYPLAEPLPMEGVRDHYRRGLFVDGCVRSFSSQDSAALKEFAHADLIIRRKAGSPALHAGDMVDVLPLSFEGIGGDI